MTGNQRSLREDAQFRILRLLHNNPEMSQRELAKGVGISSGSVHYVIGALVEKGLIKLSNFTSSEDKRRYAYILTRKGIARKTALTRAFLARKLDEFEALREEIKSLQSEAADMQVKESL
jgi:EPS-associated MarR family transcriptional regulator